MKIGFDAKRAFHNTTGLGNYSRTLIRSVADYYPEHQYYLFNPKPSTVFQLAGGNLQEVLPKDPLHRLFPAAWRSAWVTKDARNLGIDLYHGLSHEIPRGMQRAGIRSVVTIHDLIHERFPEHYARFDVAIYRAKSTYACTHADKIIAVSRQTKQDIVDYYNIPGDKISVCYQSCDPAFGRPVPEQEKSSARRRHNLPDRFFLYVGSITERKNLLSLCKAMALVRDETDIPLLVIGEGGAYKKRVKAYINRNGLERTIRFLSESEAARSSTSSRMTLDFPAIYQSAVALIYPSVFEGFGIPVLEALWSRLPVITSDVPCLREAGGEGAWYVDPGNPEEIAAGMKKIWSDASLAASLQEKGFQHAQEFEQKKCAAAVMAVYKGLVV